MLAAAESASDGSAYTIWLSPAAYRIAWFAFLVFHCLCGANFAFKAYLYLELEGTSLEQTLKAKSVGMNPSQYPIIAVVMSLVAAVHGVAIAAMICLSAYFRYLTYWFPAERDCLHRRQATLFKSTHVQTKNPPTRTDRYTSHSEWKVKVAVLQAYHSLFDPTGLLGVRGQHFLVIFQATKLVETSLQFYRADQIAAHESQLSFVRVSVAIVIINCWSTPLIHWSFRHRPNVERLLCVFSDIICNIFVTIIAPGILAIPYLREYDPETTNFSAADYSDDSWVVNMVNDLRLLMESSWLNLLVSIALSLGVVFSSLAVKELLRVSRTGCCEVRPSSVHVGKVYCGTIGNRRQSDIDRNPTDKNSPQNRSCTVWFRLILQVLVCTLGLVALVLHVTVETRRQHPNCALPLLSWHSSAPSCAYFDLNCSSIGTVGGRAEVSAVLSYLDTDSLQALVFSDCPALGIPPAIQSFKQLQMIQIRASTVIDWDVDAALTAEHHPMLGSFRALMVQMPNGKLPPGLLHPSFPPTLTVIQFLSVNIETLPPTLPTIWPSGLIFMWMSSNVKVIPTVLSRMAIVSLSLAGNQITELPIAFFYTPFLVFVQLTGNPLTNIIDVPISIVEQFGPPWQSLVSMDISATGIDTLPTWMKSRTFAVLASDSPLCSRIAAGNLTDSESFVESCTVCT